LAVTTKFRRGVTKNLALLFPKAVESRSQQ
jgi:hypothetical protein